MTAGGSDDKNRAPLWSNGGYNQNSDLFKFIQKLNSLRTSNTFQGTEQEIWVDDKFYVLSRENSCLVVVSNQDNVNVSFKNLPKWINDSTVFVNALESNGQTYQS